MAVNVGAYPLVGYTNATAYNSVAHNPSPLNATLSQFSSQINTLTGRQAALQSEATLYNNVAGALQNLNTVTRNLAMDNNFAAPTATSSNTAILTAQSGPSAPASTNTITVNALATAQQNLSAQYASHSATGTLGSGTLTIQYGSNTAVNIAVGASTSLDTLASTINAQVSGVSASVVQNGSNFQLMLQGQGTGTSNAISFTEGGTINLGLASRQTQAAANANVTFNGTTVTSQSNTLNSLLPYTSISLLAASTSPVTVTIGTSVTEINQEIADVFTAYNTVATALNAAINNANALDGYNGTSSVALLQLQKQLGDVVNGKISTAQGTYIGLPQLGITGNTDGTVNLDSGALSTALSYDQGSVQSLFNTSKGVLTQLKNISDAFGNVATGELNVSIGAMASELSTAGKRITSKVYDFTLMQKALLTQYQAFQGTMARLNEQNMILSGATATPLFTTPLYNAPSGSESLPYDSADTFAALYRNPLSTSSTSS